MHELAITQHLVDLVLEEASRAGAQRIIRVQLVVGDLRGVVDECVESYFSIISKGTMAEGAILDLRHVPGLARCRDCHVELRLERFEYLCPACGKPALDYLSGQEFIVSTMEVE